MRLTRQEYWGGLPFPSPVEEVRLDNISRKQSLVRAGVWMLLWENQAELREGKHQTQVSKDSNQWWAGSLWGQPELTSAKGPVPKRVPHLSPVPPEDKQPRTLVHWLPSAAGHPQRALTPTHAQVMSLWLTSLLWLHLLRLEKEAGTSGNASCSRVRIRWAHRIPHSAS